MLNKRLAVRVVGAMVLAAGAALGLAGLVLARADWVAASLVPLLLVVIFLLIGVRQRAHVSMQLSSAARADAADALKLLQSLVQDNAVIKRRVEGIQRTSVDAQVAALAGYRELSRELGKALATLEASRLQARSADERLIALAEGIDGRLSTHGKMLGTVAESGEQALARVRTLANKMVPVQEGVALLSSEKTARPYFRKLLAWLKLETVLDVAALSTLRDGMHGVSPLPRMTDFAMEPSGMLGVVELILAKPGAHVVELGSGSSSVLLGHAVRACQGRMTSIEHSDKYLAATARELNDHGLTAVVKLVYAPLATAESEEGSPWYDRSVVARIEGPVDVLMVDGPPKATGPGARNPALAAFADRLSPGAWVIVDDADRPDERRMVAAWREQYPLLGEPIRLSPRTIAMQLGSVDGPANDNRREG